MARAESLAKGGYYAFPPEHLSDVARLFVPSPSAAHILDPCAGEGEALHTLATSLRLSPYAIELESGRAAVCAQRFQQGQTLHADMFDVELSPQSMQMVWVNPPFTWDTAVPGKRREAGMLAFAWHWLQIGGWMVFVSYAHHLTTELIYHIASHATSIEIFRLPEKHFDTYTYTVLVAQKGRAGDPTALARQMLAQVEKPDMLPLLTESSGTRRIPASATVKDMYFHKRFISPDEILQSVLAHGADKSTSFQIAVRPAPEVGELNPPMRLKIGHLVTLVAGGMFNYLPLTTERGRAMLRSVVRYVEELANTEETPGKSKKEVYVLRPKTTITLLHEDGELENIADDELLNSFIQRYKQQLFAYAEQKFIPRYNMIGDTPEKRQWLPFMMRQLVKGKHPLFAAQMHVGAAICTTLEQIHRCLFIGEMSTGKTAVSLAIMDAWFKAGKVKPGQVMWVNCPSHLVRKWKREANAQLPDAEVTILTLKDDGRRLDMQAVLGNAMRRAEHEPERLHIVIGAQDAIKLGEGWGSAYQQHSIKKYLMCATTGEPIIFEFEGQKIPAAKEALETKQAYSADRRYAYWQEVRKYGLPKGHNGRAKRVGNRVVSLVKGEPIVDDWLALKGVRMGNPRAPVWRLVQGAYRGRIAIAFFDEAHGSKDIATDRYRSMAAIARAADNIVGVSGTIFNGYASSLYGLETIFNPSLFERYPWGNAGISQFVRDMGVLEKVIEYKDEYTTNGVHTGVKRVNHGAKERPGASPLLIQMLLEHAVFLSLADIGTALPKLTEAPAGIAMATEQASAYETGVRAMKAHLLECRSDGDASFLGTYFHSSLAYPDTAHMPLAVNHHKITRNPYSRRIIDERLIHVHTFPAIEHELLPKESWLVDTAHNELEEGRGLAVFVSQTDKRDYQPRLAELLRRHAGANPVILYSDTVAPIDREEWIENEFANGRNILICSPRLVETGLDLVMCPTLIFFEPEYQLAVLAQAARRHWRIPQTKDCRTFFAFYEGTIQQKAMSLIADKLQSLAVVNGESASLSALSQIGDIVKELMKDNVIVKDLRAEFAAINNREFHDAEWEQAMLHLAEVKRPVLETETTTVVMATVDRFIPFAEVTNELPPTRQLTLF